MGEAAASLALSNHEPPCFGRWVFRSITVEPQLLLLPNRETRVHSSTVYTRIVLRKWQDYTPSSLCGLPAERIALPRGESGRRNPGNQFLSK